MTGMEIYCMRFGPYSRTLTVGFTGGILVFSVSAPGELELLYDSTREYCDVHCAECIYDSLYLVQFRTPRHFILYNIAERKEAGKIEFAENIITFKANNCLILIRLLQSLHVLDAATNQCIKVLKDVTVESTAMAVCYTTHPTYFAYPSNTGSVSICNFVDDYKVDSISTVRPSDKNITQIEFNPSGALIAVSCAGEAVIYVFEVTNGQNIHRFMRGLTKNAIITSLFFTDDDYLVCSSDSDTVHIFEINPRSSTIGSYLSNAVSYLPFSSSFVMPRSSIRVKISTQGFRTSAYYWKNGWMCWMMVASYCGLLHMFLVDVPNKQCIVIPTKFNVLTMDIKFPTNENEDFDSDKCNKAELAVMNETVVETGSVESVRSDVEQPKVEMIGAWGGSSTSSDY